MGRPFFEMLDGRVYCCKHCRVHLASTAELLSKAFHSKSGRAFLFQRACNVCYGPQEERMMTTGMHVVCDIQCTNCMAVVGWKYEVAYEKSQKYKEGKYILERAAVLDVDDEGAEQYDSDDEY